MNRRIRPSITQSQIKPFCPRCEGEDLDVDVYNDTVDFRGIELDVPGLERSVCRKCSNVFESPAQSFANMEAMRKAYSKERDRLRARDGLLSTDDIAEIRKQFSLDQKEAAYLFGGGPNAFNKYESGEVLQSVPMDRLLRISRVFGPRSISILSSIANNHSLKIGSGISNAVFTHQRKQPSYLTVSLEGHALFVENKNTVSRIVEVLSSTHFRPESGMFDGFKNFGIQKNNYMDAPTPISSYVEIKIEEM